MGSFRSCLKILMKRVWEILGFRRKKKFAPVHGPAGIPPKGEGEYVARDIGKAGAVSELHKLALAEQLVEKYDAGEEAYLPQILERRLDSRICSMIAYHLALRVFDIDGRRYLESHPGLIDLLHLDFSTTREGRPVNYGVDLSQLMPVKYRGYGHPVNSVLHHGHLFVVNILCFPTFSRTIGIRATGAERIEVVKGMEPIGRVDDLWLYALNPELTDDPNAIFTCPVESGSLLEVVHYTGADDWPIIYRFERD